MTKRDDLSPEAAAASEGIREAARREVDAAFGSKPKGRHVVQIAAAANTVFALCADGSVWKHNPHPDRRPDWVTGEVEGDWTQLPAIPDRS